MHHSYFYAAQRAPSILIINHGTVSSFLAHDPHHKERSTDYNVVQCISSNQVHCQNSPGWVHW